MFVIADLGKIKIKMHYLNVFNLRDNSTLIVIVAYLSPAEIFIVTQCSETNTTPFTLQS